MRKIKWHLTIGYPAADREGDFEVEDDASDEEIEKIARDEAYNFIEWNWSEADDPT